jgi:serpin B
MSLSGVCRKLVPVALAVTACSDPSSPGSAKQIDALPRPLSISEQKLIAGSNTFAFDLFRTINKAQRSENVFISPLSASMALGMAAGGASGDTYTAMHDALRLGNATKPEVNEGYKSLIEMLRGLDPATDFRIANSIWYESKYPFNSSFLADGKSFFDATVSPLDFKNPSSVNTVNAWVSDNTGKKIPKILEAMDPDEVMLLINAIYFKGTWQKQFKKSETNNAPFMAYDGTTAQVPMMHQSNQLRRAFGPDYDGVDLLYGNSAFAMTILLPRPGVDVNTFAEKLTPESWSVIEKSFHESEADLYLPRFKLAWDRKLNSDLISMGMGLAFTDAATFGGMSSQAPNLMISKVIQKTFVDVNEEGTEAAAATSVGAVPTSAPASLRVDRPFVVMIRERFSGSILFVGKIAKLPAAS